MYYVEQKHVMRVIDTVFCNSPPEEIEEVKTKINKIVEEKCKVLSIIDPTQLPINSAMVLRILLEYYRNEKKAKSYIIKRLF